MSLLQEFVAGLSVLSRGTLAEKLQWIFSLYDINSDGYISRDEMLDIISAIYDMMGRFSDPCIDENTAREHVERVFEVRHKLCIDSRQQLLGFILLSLQLYFDSMFL